MKIVVKTDISAIPLLSRGKVRDIYAVDGERLLIVTTDRMSAFDVMMAEPIPYKGVILNRITIFWMNKFKDIVPNHLLESDVEKFPAELAPWKDELDGRAVIVKKAKPLPVECIVRGYISGSAWNAYQKGESVCGYHLPPGLEESARLPKPIFTPSTKAELGRHDENITVKQAGDLLGHDICSRIEAVSLKLYDEGQSHAIKGGIIVADTKFEFGLIDGRVHLIDEVLTPDSSRFWAAARYRPGGSQPSFDKQYLRDWLKSQPWNMQPPPPPLPEDVIKETAEKYREAYEILTK